MSASYFYLRSGIFSVIGFTYGKVEGVGTRGGKARVKLVSSGRWSEEHAQVVEVTETEIASRGVTSEEALNGAGTFQISLHRSGTVTDNSAQVAVNRGEDTMSKTHFQPTGMQTTFHLALVNGKYASFTAQQCVEFVQVHWRKFGFFPHPAVLRGLFGWDFGTRALSILHFVRVTEL
ncbi:hypothetical protein PHYPSEUDO_003687 [Phytophthora pseudosyringae]|uniref:Uncharacterized protein n=1 Tax=Phytophthora pseudosyringae TaxID=221518 RepID=A0A8T1VQA9_9STRA|nr:hypothetical protein PHYPSEUDO_003687 [Phytophthora pseudosyringae]